MTVPLTVLLDNALDILIRLDAELFRLGSPVALEFFFFSFLFFRGQRMQPVFLCRFADQVHNPFFGIGVLLLFLLLAVTLIEVEHLTQQRGGSSPLLEAGLHLLKSRILLHRNGVTAHPQRRAPQRCRAQEWEGEVEAGLHSILTVARHHEAKMLELQATVTLGSGAV
jgi:hypothetical protein